MSIFFSTVWLVPWAWLLILFNPERYGLKVIAVTGSLLAILMLYRGINGILGKVAIAKNRIILVIFFQVIGLLLWILTVIAPSDMDFLYPPSAGAWSSLARFFFPLYHLLPWSIGYVITQGIRKQYRLVEAVTWPADGFKASVVFWIIWLHVSAVLAFLILYHFGLFWFRDLY
jgi:hypothetical protein